MTKNENSLKKKEKNLIFNPKSIINFSFSNKNSFEFFLKEQFKDLQFRSNEIENSQNKITKITFQELFKFPMILSERLFFSLTLNLNSTEISKEEFTNGLLKLYSNNLKNRIEIFLNIIDFDLDGVILIDDLIMLLCAFFAHENNFITNFKEIREIIYKIFPPKKRITVNSFYENVFNFNADVFYLFCFYFDKFCPFLQEQINFFECFYYKNSNDFDNNLILKIPPSKKLINFFKKIYNINVMKENFDENSFDENDDFNDLIQFEKDISNTFLIIANENKKNNQTEIIKDNIKFNLNNISTSTTTSTNNNNNNNIKNIYSKTVNKNPLNNFIDKNYFCKFKSYSPLKKKNSNNNTPPVPPFTREQRLFLYVWQIGKLKTN